MLAAGAGAARARATRRDGAFMGVLRDALPLGPTRPRGALGRTCEREVGATTGVICRRRTGTRAGREDRKGAERERKWIERNKAPRTHPPRSARHAATL